MSQKIELPGVVEVEPEKTHISITLINDGLKQAEANLTEQEAALKKLTDQMTQLQAQRIAMAAQRNLLLELLKKITEVENTTK
jgi:F0F1-type ATP synthase membrane subunit b/b'